jgi:hypothetical protein
MAEGETNAMVRRMAGDGAPIKQIVRHTGLSRKLVRQILRGEREDAFRIRQSSLTPGGDPSCIFCSGQADQADLPGTEALAEDSAQDAALGRDSVRVPP